MLTRALTDYADERGFKGGDGVEARNARMLREDIDRVRRRVTVIEKALDALRSLSS